MVIRDQKSKALIGMKAICNYLTIGKNLFYEFVARGAPISKTGTAWTAHKDELDAWFVKDKELYKSLLLLKISNSDSGGGPPHPRNSAIEE